MSLIASLATAIAALILFGSMWLLEKTRSARARLREEAARKQMAARIRFLAGHASDCIILCDASGRIVEANERCFVSYGYSQKEWLRLNMDDLTTARHFTLPGLVQQVPEERGVTCRSLHVRKGGTAFDVEMGVSLTEVDGRPCYQLIIRDLSEPKQFSHGQETDTQQLSKLARHLVNIQEQEWQRLGGELHDQVGANLATINLNLRSIRKMMPNPDPQLEGRLKEAGNLLADTIFSIRNACTELRPAVLYYSGLVSALEELVQRAERRGDMKVRFRQENMQERLSQRTESMLFRIVQEALTNCAKHSNASEVEVAIYRQDRTIALSVSDNGSGFDPGKRGSTGLGLLTMRERASMAGGNLSIDSCPGRGTQIRVVVPDQGQRVLRKSGGKMLIPV